jgi:hypothetical protein
MDITPREFWLAVKDKDKYEESKIKPVCEAIRTSTWWLVNVAVDKRSKVRKKERIMTFPWDKAYTPKKPQTREEMKEVMKMMAIGKLRPGEMGVRERRLHKEKLRQQRLQQQRERLKNKD